MIVHFFAGIYPIVILYEKFQVQKIIKEHSVPDTRSEIYYRYEIKYLEGEVSYKASILVGVFGGAVVLGRILAPNYIGMGATIYAAILVIFSIYNHRKTL